MRLSTRWDMRCGAFCISLSDLQVLKVQVLEVRCKFTSRSCRWSIVNIQMYLKMWIVASYPSTLFRPSAHGVHSIEHRKNWNVGNVFLPPPSSVSNGACCAYCFAGQKIKRRLQGDWWWLDTRVSFARNSGICPHMISVSFRMKVWEVAAQSYIIH